jgi:hypothetical protein
MRNRTTASSAVDKDAVSFLKPYHDKAKQFDTNPTFTFVGGIKTVKTSIGDFTGFFVKGKNIIFYHPDSLAVLIERNGSDISEISVGEVEQLFN